jgi:hypothetical protein
VDGTFLLIGEPMATQQEEYDQLIEQAMRERHFSKKQTLFMQAEKIKKQLEKELEDKN